MADKLPLKNSSTIRKALDVEGQAVIPLIYTRDELIWVRENIDTIWDVAVERAPQLEDYFNTSIKVSDILHLCEQFQLFFYPPIEGIDEVTVNAAPMLRSVMVTSILTMGLGPTLTLLRQELIAPLLGVFVGLQDLFNVERLTNDAVSVWQLRTITEWIAIAAKRNYPTKIRFGTIHYFSLLEYPEEFYDHLLPGILAAYRERPTISTH